MPQSSTAKACTARGAPLCFKASRAKTDCISFGAPSLDGCRTGKGEVEVHGLSGHDLDLLVSSPELLVTGFHLVVSRRKLRKLEVAMLVAHGEERMGDHAGVG